MMRSFFSFLLRIGIVAASFAPSAHAQSGAVYLATYVDVMPNAADASRDTFDRYRNASRKEDGNLRFDVLRETGRTNRFAIIEVWSDKAALDAHAKAASTAQFRDTLKAIQNAPYDERTNNGLYVGPAKSEGRAGTVYVVTHVDVIPLGKDECLGLLKAMSIDTPKDTGNISYEVLQQANRANHFTVIEAWRDKKALDSHAMAAHTRSFRESLSPIAGALYDERFYKALD
jgi:autoinducer 2-degrading protein